MLLAFERASATLIILACLDLGTCVLAKTGDSAVKPPPVDEANRDEPAAAAHNGTTETVSGDDVSEDRLRRGGFRQTFGFPWIKFSLVLLALFVWLRALRLCTDDARSRQLPVNSRIRRLFAIGLTGILIAVLLPSYVLGAIVLVASCAVPFWRYVRWQNAQVSDPMMQLRWSHLLSSRETVEPSVGDVELTLPSSLTALPAGGKITFVGRSFGERITRAEASKAVKGSGFEIALALIGQAVSRSATDLHVGAKDDGVSVRLRIDGEIVALEPLPLRIGLSVINVFKVLSDLDIADKRRSQDGTFRADVEGRRLFFRVASQGTNTGEKLSIRILDPAEKFSTFPALGVNDRLHEQLVAMLGRKNGLILFAGTTGAGKSTTAYAALRQIDSGDRNIATIEEPIEYNIPSIDQIEVKARLGHTFETALRSVLRQDTDVVLIGEIRDEETARIACRAAMTGQLVLSTLHATDSVSAVLRLSDLGVGPYNVAASLRAVVGQQLVRRLCTQCRIVHEPDEQMLQRLGIPGFPGVVYQRPDPLSNSCLECNSRGFLGRTGIFELLEVTAPIRDLIRDEANVKAVASAAREQGMTSLWDTVCVWFVKVSLPYTNYSSPSRHPEDVELSV